MMSVDNGVEVTEDNFMESLTPDVVLGFTDSPASQINMALKLMYKEERPVVLLDTTSLNFPILLIFTPRKEGSGATVSWKINMSDLNPNYVLSLAMGIAEQPASIKELLKFQEIHEVYIDRQLMSLSTQESESWND